MGGRMLSVPRLCIKPHYLSFLSREGTHWARWKCFVSPFSQGHKKSWMPPPKISGNPSLFFSLRRRHKTSLKVPLPTAQLPSSHAVVSLRPNYTLLKKKMHYWHVIYIIHKNGLSLAPKNFISTAEAVNREVSKIRVYFMRMNTRCTSLMCHIHICIHRIFLRDSSLILVIYFWG